MRTEEANKIAKIILDIKTDFTLTEMFDICKQNGFIDKDKIIETFEQMRDSGVVTHTFEENQIKYRNSCKKTPKSYSKSDLVKAIDTFKNTSKHIKTIKLKGNENDVLSFSADYVRAIEVAIEVMNEQIEKDII